MTIIVGMNRDSGAPLAGLAHLSQSIRDILTTRRGARRMRPEYGSNLPALVDAPVNAGWKSAVQAEIATALNRWEPRLRLDRVEVLAVTGGEIRMRLAGEYLGDDVVLEVSA